jgi:hypothetical protein
MEGKFKGLSGYTPLGKQINKGRKATKKMADGHQTARHEKVPVL